MAEFKEVMQQWARMCNSVPGKSEYISICSDKESGYICPMKDCGLCNKSLSSQTDDDRLIGERTIMEWATEHPAPVYPTWRDLFERMGANIRCDGTVQFQLFAADKPIPADMAQKLGIEPKEE